MLNHQDLGGAWSFESSQAGISDFHESIFDGPKRGFCQHAGR
jgi:hypothetical protein